MLSSTSASFAFSMTAVGTHEMLYETCPSYRKMVDLQKLEEEGAGHAV